MKIEITKATKKYPTFSELHSGDIFIPLCDDSCVYMKGVYSANGKIKAIRLADGCVTDLDGNKYVILCKATLKVEIDKD